jgi:hypothetical protein
MEWGRKAEVASATGERSRGWGGTSSPDSPALFPSENHRAGYNQEPAERMLSGYFFLQEKGGE